MRIFNYLQKIYILLKIDFIGFEERIINYSIDISIVIIANVIIFGNIIKEFGLQNFSLFAHCGLLGAMVFWELFPCISDIIYDLDHEKKISYELTLPLPTSLIFVKKALSYSLKMFILMFVVLPIGKIFLWDELIFTISSFVKFVVFNFLNCLFCGVFGIFLVSILKTSKNINSLWNRFLFPIWIFGGYQFSWKAMNSVFPRFSYISLFNPMIYITEGMRNILINSHEFISFEVCSLALIFFILLFGYIGIYRMKKFLDHC